MTYTNKVELKGFLGADAQPKDLGRRQNRPELLRRDEDRLGQRRIAAGTHRMASRHAWDQVANQSPEFTRGAYVHVIGTLRSREYGNGEGRVQTYDIVASKIEILPRESAGEACKQEVGQ
jgi:single-stranded DNA-binding protein